MNSKAKAGPAWGEQRGCARAPDRLSKETGLGKALLSVPAKAGPRLPRQCHSHGLGLPQEPGKASHEGRLPRQISDSPGILDARLLTLPCRLQGLCPAPQPAGPRSLGQADAISQASLPWRFHGLLAGAGSELSPQPRPLSRLRWLLIIAGRSPHFLAPPEAGWLGRAPGWLQGFLGSGCPLFLAVS